MPAISEQKRWELYCQEELAALTPVLSRLGFSLEQEQPHLGGERYLMYAVTITSGRKLILVGSRVSDGLRVIIKATRDGSGKRELARERACRRALEQIKFAYEVFRAPEEILFTRARGFTISIQQFLEQERPFLERALEEQFFLALRAFKSQESAHATTYGHQRQIRKTFGYTDAAEYEKTFSKFRSTLEHLNLEEPRLTESLAAAHQHIRTGLETIEQYGGFLTHTDFVPHNVRVLNGCIYLLDHSAIRFGNKYEGWARFINFMTLYNPDLADALITYVAANRTEEEAQALTLMRLYRLGEIIYYYAQTLPKSDGNLLKLNRARLTLWSRILESTVRNERLPEEILTTYKNTRDALRSDDEKKRQQGLH